ncbi:MAG: DDE-type integrase/transposase/recombinase [Pseudomonadota bacterium]
MSLCNKSAIAILLKSRRDKKSAERLMKKLLKKWGCVPRVLITDKLKSYGAAKKDIILDVEGRLHRRLENIVLLR